MSTTSLKVYISDGDGNSVTINGMDSASSDGLCCTFDGIEGWYSAPDAKVTQTEQQTGNGAYDVPSSDVLYAARTVVIHLIALDETRAGVVYAMDKLGAMHGKLVTIRVVDARFDTYIDHAYIDVKWGSNRYETASVGTLTIVCPRPMRLSSQQITATMVPTTGNGGGMVFDSGVLHWPISFGSGAVRSNNVCTINNSGTFMSDVIITASGNMPSGLTITNVSDGTQLAYSGIVSSVPLVLDSRTHTATIGGVDVSRNLTQRHFPTIPAGGSITLTLITSGTGSVTATTHDTYI